MLKVTFLGTASVMPETGGDSTTFLINDTILIDTGWNVALRLPLFGIDPLRITHLLFSHFHHDHYLGLPQFLFQRGLLAAKQPAAPPLIIGGPTEDLMRIINLARQFLEADRHPEVFPAIDILPLQPGDQLLAGELSVVVGRASHPVPAHGYRITDNTSGASLGITGDTEYIEDLPGFFQGVDLLIAEASFGARSAPENNPYRHMGALDAARLAKEAGAKRLALTHGKIETREPSVVAARSLFPDTFWPKDGATVILAE